jgi:hypothetical protein
MLVAGVPQGLLGAEMMLHQADRDAGGVGDGLYRRALEATLGELRQGGVSDPGSGDEVFWRTVAS